MLTEHLPLPEILLPELFDMRADSLKKVLIFDIFYWKDNFYLINELSSKL